MFCCWFEKITCVVYASENKLSSNNGLIENVYDYGENIMCKVSKLYSGIEYVKIDLLSLNTNDGNSKRTRVKTNHYTDNYIKRDNNKTCNREDTKKSIRRNCKTINKVW